MIDRILPSAGPPAPMVRVVVTQFPDRVVHDVTSYMRSLSSIHLIHSIDDPTFTIILESNDDDNS